MLTTTTFQTIVTIAGAPTTASIRTATKRPTALTSALPTPTRRRRPCAGAATGIVIQTAMANAAGGGLTASRSARVTLLRLDPEECRSHGPFTIGSRATRAFCHVCLYRNLIIDTFVLILCITNDYSSVTDLYTLYTRCSTVYRIMILETHPSIFSIKYVTKTKTRRKRRNYFYAVPPRLS